MTPIIQAAAQGYSAQQILNFLSQAFPLLVPKIKQASKSGYDANKILKFINQMMEHESFDKNMTPNQIEAAHKERLNRNAKKILGAAATAPLIGGFLKNLPSLAQNLLGAGTATASNIPNSPLPPGAPSPQNPIGPAPMANAPVSPPPIQGIPQGGIQSPSIPVAAQAQQQPALITPRPPQKPVGFGPEQSIDIVEDLGIADKLDKLKTKGKSLQQISEEVWNSLTPEQKAKLPGGRPPFISLVKDYLTTHGRKVRDDQSFQKSEGMESSSQKLDETKKTSEIERPKKGSLVATPHGIGEVKSERNGQALVEHDGKLHKVDADDLIASPIPEKDLADLTEELIGGIEKKTGEEVSRNVFWAGYNPELNELMYLPHDGSLYVYENIEPEEAKILTSILNTRKTTGENFIGAWSAGSKSPIGAAMSALIQRLQKERGGKGSEYSAKVPTLYSAFEPAIKALKEKKRKKKK